MTSVVERNRTLISLAAFTAPVMFVVTVIGFWPTYYAAVGKIHGTLHLHNLLMMIWMCLLILQPVLIRLNRRLARRRIGQATTFVLAPLMVAVGLVVTREFLQKFDGQFPPVAYSVFVVSVVSIAHFAILVALAFHFRHRVELHARFMVATGLVLSSAALLRVYLQFGWADSFDSASKMGLLVIGTVLAILTINDFRLHRFASPFLLPLALFGVQHVCMVYAANTSWLQSFASAFAG